MIEDLIFECTRELKMRQQVYPKLIQSRRMTQDQADDQTAKLKVIQQFLQYLKFHTPEAFGNFKDFAIKRDKYEQDELNI